MSVAEQERRFLIRHRDWTDGATLELNDWGFFLEEYEPQGFEVVANPPAGYWGGPSEPKTVTPGKRGKKKEEDGAAEGDGNVPEAPESSGS